MAEKPNVVRKIETEESLCEGFRDECRLSFSHANYTREEILTEVKRRQEADRLLKLALKNSGDVSPSLEKKSAVKQTAKPVQKELKEVQKEASEDFLVPEYIFHLHMFLQMFKLRKRFSQKYNDIMTYQMSTFYRMISFFILIGRLKKRARPPSVFRPQEPLARLPATAKILAILLNDESNLKESRMSLGSTCCRPRILILTLVLTVILTVVLVPQPPSVRHLTP